MMPNGVQFGAWGCTWNRIIWVANMAIKVLGLLGTEIKLYPVGNVVKKWWIPKSQWLPESQIYTSKKSYNALLKNGLHLNDILDIQDAKHKSKGKCIKCLWMVDDITRKVNPSSDYHQCSSQGTVWLMFTSHTSQHQRTKVKGKENNSFVPESHGETKEKEGRREISWWPSQRFKVSLFTIPLLLSICMKLSSQCVIGHV